MQFASLPGSGSGEEAVTPEDHGPSASRASFDRKERGEILDDLPCRQDLLHVIDAPSGEYRAACRLRYAPHQGSRVVVVVLPDTSENQAVMTELSESPYVVCSGLDHPEFRLS